MFVSIYGNCRSVALLTVLCVGAAALANAAEDAGKYLVNVGTTATTSVQVPAYFERSESQSPVPVNLVARMRKRPTKDICKTTHTAAISFRINWSSCSEKLIFQHQMMRAFGGAI